FHRMVERLAGHLPEIGMAAMGGAPEAILHLLVAPQGGERRRAVAQHIGAAGRRRTVVEQRAIGIEHASLDPVETVRHSSLPPDRGRHVARLGPCALVSPHKENGRRSCASALQHPCASPPARSPSSPPPRPAPRPPTSPMSGWSSPSRRTG